MKKYRRQIFNNNSITTKKATQSAIKKMIVNGLKASNNEIKNIEVL